MPFSIDIPQLRPLIAALNAWPDIARPILGDAASAALLSLVPYLATYPEQPATTTYRRTGQQGREWVAARPEFAPISSGFEATLGNRRPGAIYIQGEYQPDYMRHWQTAEQVINDHQTDVEAYFDAALQRIVEAVDAKAGS